MIQDVATGLQVRHICYRGMKQGNMIEKSMEVSSRACTAWKEYAKRKDAIETWQKQVGLFKALNIQGWYSNIFVYVDVCMWMYMCIC
jgi:hypothetical protein